MSSLIRKVLILFVAAFLAMPSVCDEGGEGESGVWVLPFAFNVGGAPTSGSVAPRETHVASTTGADIRMRTAAGMGSATATFVDDLSGLPVALAVSGRMVTISKNVLQALAASPKPSATVLVTDAQQCGYVMRVAVQADGSVEISIF